MPMKTIPILAVGASLVLAAGCTTTSHPSPQYAPPSAASSPWANLLIISATYGSGVNFADVTGRVDDLLHRPSVEFFARPEWLQADPTHGWNKALVIVYEYNGRRNTFTTGEGGRVNVELLVQHAKRNN